MGQAKKAYAEATSKNEIPDLNLAKKVEDAEKNLENMQAKGVGGSQNYSKNLIRKNKRLNVGLKTQKKKRRKKRKNKYNKYNEYNNTLKININPSQKKSKKNILIKNTSLKRK